ncbi:hypothetical protein HOLleu_27018 [Holothuria leucospilota]|uniref:Uncharacterized protein n=1 Tax=Holothuria leucospilota TaxID=206669 RepID=A0A9Q1BQ05_HOLLE|nr:hypothetical protein HOLleu_27018 [Holothuria leucospilota]
MCSLVTEIIMHHITVVVVAYIIRCSLLVFVGSQEIFFELKDSEINEVIYIGERDIEMRCGVTSLLHADLIIDHNGTVVATSTGNTVTYVIEEITQSDGWTFTCAVDFTFPNGTRFNEQANLVLNVQTITPYCFHNGSSVGENVLQLTCYCLVNVNCLWVTSYLRVVSIGPMKTCVHNNKSVSRVMIPLAPTEDCLYCTRSTHMCYYPLNDDSSNRFHLNPLPELPELPEWGCDGFPTQTIPHETSDGSSLYRTTMTEPQDVTTMYTRSKLTATTTTTPTPTPTPTPTQANIDPYTTAENKSEEPPIVITVCIIVPVAILIIVVIAILFYRRRQRKRKTQRPSADNGGNDNCPLYDRSILPLSHVDHSSSYEIMSAKQNTEASPTYEREIHRRAPPTPLLTFNTFTLNLYHNSNTTCAMEAVIISCIEGST